MKYLHYYDTKTAHDAVYNGNGYEEPWTAYVEDDKLVTYNKPHDYSKDYLTFKALESGTFKFSGNSVSYSTDSGKTWTTLASDTDSPTVEKGKYIMWKGELTPASSNGVGKFSSTGNYEAMGNPYSLLFGDNFEGVTDLTRKSYAIRDLFNGSTKLTSAKNMSLPATSLAAGCYMSMFRDCTSLTAAPELPATTMPNNCYAGMFRGCTSLTTAPELPATTLNTSCYSGMFYGCTSLSAAPVLPAAMLGRYCYDSMFNGCTSLNYIKAMFTTTPSSINTGNWVKDVASTGTFVKNSAATWNVTGVNGIPEGWTVETASA